MKTPKLNQLMTLMTLMAPYTKAVDAGTGAALELTAKAVEAAKASGDTEGIIAGLDAMESALLDFQKARKAGAQDC